MSGHNPDVVASGHNSGRGGVDTGHTRVGGVATGHTRVGDCGVCGGVQ